MAARRNRQWVFLGPVPLLADLRFARDRAGSKTMPGSALVWFAAPAASGSVEHQQGFDWTEGRFGCPLCGGSHAYRGWVYRGQRSESSRGRRRPCLPPGDPSVLSLVCEASRGRLRLGDDPPCDAPEAGVDDLIEAWHGCRAEGRQVALYAGAGVSAGSGVPTAREVRSRLGVSPATRAGFRKALRDPAGVFDVLADLVAAVDGGDREPCACHDLIRDLTEAGRVDWVLTTNGDRLLEEAGVETLRVFDQEEVRRWQAAVESRGEVEGRCGRFVRSLRMGRVGLYMSVGSSSLVGREMGSGLVDLLLGSAVRLFQITPETPNSMPAGRWIPLTAGEALGGLLRTPLREHGRGTR